MLDDGSGIEVQLSYPDDEATSGDRVAPVSRSKGFDCGRVLSATLRDYPEQLLGPPSGN
ncbi:hypothetical protein [Muricoccus nepalensis]|uniref:hypothetical protein n=1 Tax=Muricoccus nepalensis TaxID=1854500 RepID=UPI001386CD20|nr:hypothetical protein [Roseomonas nepalensis]